jgi:hypothetical protein
MGENSGQRMGSGRLWLIIIAIIFACIVCAALFLGRYPRTLTVPDTDSTASAAATTTTNQTSSLPTLPPLDIAEYNQKLIQLANIHIKTIANASASLASTTSTTLPTFTTPALWPVATAYPNAGAILPFKRIVAYYGNFYSTQMGVLGEFPPDQMLHMLSSTVAEWNAADPSTPVLPALDYIVVTAQGSPGADGMYRLRMPDSQIEKAITLADQMNGVVFLDVQVGLSTVETEVPLLEKYLKMPQVELSLDPEFDMHNGERPGTVIGTMDASDINFAAQYLANLVRLNNLPPKILVVHRFTEDMVTNYKKIQPLPEVEVVMDMDGFGFPAKKINTYARVIVPEPVQFTGFKLFYKNDVAGSMGHLMTPSEVLQLSPQPSYIQYQ